MKSTGHRDPKGHDPLDPYFQKLRATRQGDVRSVARLLAGHRRAHQKPRSLRWLIAHPYAAAASVLLLFLVLSAAVPVQVDERVGELISWQSGHDESTAILEEIDGLMTENMRMEVSVRRQETHDDHDILVLNAPKRVVRAMAGVAQRSGKAFSVKSVPIHRKVGRTPMGMLLDNLFPKGVQLEEMSDEEMYRITQEGLEEKGIDNATVEVLRDKQGRRRVKIVRELERPIDEMEITVHGREQIERIRKELDPADGTELREFLREELDGTSGDEVRLDTTGGTYKIMIKKRSGN